MRIMNLVPERWRPRMLKWMLNIYPPFLGAGVRVMHVADDYSRVDVRMKLRFWNRNYVGTHFGGSLYSMCDPHFMLILFHQLGRDYVVWDKAATIRFVRPGRGTVYARFEVSTSDVAELRRQADSQSSAVEPILSADVVDDEGTIIARIEKRLYIRRKTAGRETSTPPPAPKTAEER